MRINNVEKFRNEVYGAIEDAWLWDKIEKSAATWKGDFDDYKDSMTEYDHYEFEDGKPYLVSLAQPMRISEGENSVYITVDKDGVTFYKSTEKQFVYKGCLDAGLYKNKMSYMMALVNRINSKLNLK